MLDGLCASKVQRLFGGAEVARARPTGVGAVELFALSVWRPASRKDADDEAGTKKMDFRTRQRGEMVLPLEVQCSHATHMDASRWLLAH